MPRTYHKAARPQDRGGRAVARAFNESADWSDHQGCEALYANHPIDILRALHPWRRLSVLLILLAPAMLHTVTALPYRATLTTMGMFLLIGIFCDLINDLVDAKKDAQNPYLKSRPIAARQLSEVMIAVLLLITFGGAAYLAVETMPGTILLSCGALLLITRLFYTTCARRIDGAAPFIRAFGFLIPVYTGACMIPNSEAIDLTWLYLSVFCGGLFVTLCRQRADAFLRDNVGKGRPPQMRFSLADQHWFDLQVALSGATFIVSYLLLLWANDEAGLGSVPLMLFALFRYLRLAFGERNGSRPNILKDKVLIITLILWVAALAL